MVTNVNVGQSTASTAAASTSEPQVIQFPNLNDIRYGTLMCFPGIIQGPDKDQGLNPRVWVAPYLEDGVSYLDSEGNEITVPSTIPIYLRGNVTAEEYIQSMGTDLALFYVTKGQINARFDAVYENQLASLLQRQYGGDRNAVIHLPLRQKPDSSNGQDEESLRRRAAQDKALNTNLVRGARSMGMNSEGILKAAGLQQAVQKGGQFLGDLFSGL